MINKELFWIDQKRKRIKTYNNLIDDLAQETTLAQLITHNDPYFLFRDLILAISNNHEVILVDPDFSEEEKERLSLGQNRVLKLARNYQHQTWESLIKSFNDNKLTAKVGFFTSGTTGKPKLVFHTLANLIRGIKTGSKYAGKVWGLAFNPTHFAGIQVFLQAFLNRNPLVSLFGSSNEDIGDLIQKYQITNISGTPTFYRTNLSSLDNPFHSVKTLTSGGEKFDDSLVSYLNHIFPNARIKNIYASSEVGTVFAAQLNSSFKISDIIKDLVSISNENELLIHKSLLGVSSDFAVEGDWYHTGDMVKMVSENTFIFTGRKSDYVNVGGYKVNPAEIEEEILKLEEVKDCVIKGKQNRITGNIIIAEIVPQNNLYDHKTLERFISEQLKSKLQPWKLPRLFKFTESIQINRSGKKVRS